MSGCGKFIVFEGLDGSGKTTQLTRLNKILGEMKIPSVTTREPSDGVLGRVIRNAISKELKFQPETLALMFAADRLEHIVNEVVPMLKSGVTVLCDRYVYSNLVYQGISQPASRIAELNHDAISRLMPDLVLFIDTPPEACAKRLHSKRVQLDLFEDTENFPIYRERFIQAFELLKGKSEVCFVDGSGSEDEVFGEVWAIVKERLAF